MRLPHIAVLTFSIMQLACAAPSSTAPEEAAVIGVNLAGAEFGKGIGLHGKDYTYPGPAQFDYFKSKEMIVIRLPFKWERLQHTLMGELAEAELAHMDRTIALARERDMKLILDMHNYARYDGKLIGTGDVPNAAFADVWRRIATHYKDEPAVFAYGVMNEPHGTNGLWPAAAQAAVDAIRAVDTTHTVMVCGDGWSGAHSWQKINEAFLLTDPADNLVYEAHQYFDHDNSGSYRRSYDDEGAHPTIGVDRLKPFADWLKEHDARGFIGEFGVPDNDPRWLVVLDNFLAAMKENGMGGTYWAAGPWWGEYPLSLEPRDGKDRPQMAVFDYRPSPDADTTDKPWLAAAAKAEEAAREAQAAEAVAKVVHDFGKRRESYHYSNEGSEFGSEATQDNGRDARKITYRHRGNIAWVGLGLYFGALNCGGYEAFTLDVRAEKPCRLEIKAYHTNGDKYAGTFAVGVEWQKVVIPFATLTRDGKGFDPSLRLEKIEFQPNPDHGGSALYMGPFGLAVTSP